jgi:hypothetical protein
MYIVVHHMLVVEVVEEVEVELEVVEEVEEAPQV